MLVTTATAGAGPILVVLEKSVATANLSQR